MIFARSLLLLLAVGALATPATAAPAPERLPAGATVAGVGVGGLGPVGAERQLRRELGARYERPVTVAVKRRRRTVSPTDAGLSIDYKGMVQKAFALAARGAPVAVPLSMSVSSAKLSAAVDKLGRSFSRAPRDARVRFGIRDVVRIRHRLGRRLDGKGLRAKLLAELRSPTARRTLRVGLRTVRPRVTTGELARFNHTFVSIDRGSFKLRLFKRLRVVRVYPVAVGAAGFDTPSGLQRIQSKQRNPTWYVPNRPWAGELAGQVIPPGDPRNPLKAWFLSLGGGVGIHGTAEEWSLGSRASHGCIRMRVRHVKLLAPRVSVGTPVLIR